MSELQLGFAFAENPRSLPLLNGSVKPQGIDLIPTRASMSEVAWRQLGYQEFDISELSISSYLMARDHGTEDWVGLPVFSSRRFFHTRIIVREDAGISTPAELAGKRVGLPEYQQTAALWGRAFLQHECGVAASDIHWFMERLPERSHGGVTGFTPPPDVELTYIPESTNVGEMLAGGALDAALLYVSGGDLVDRSTRTFGPGSGIRPLFPDLRAEGARYFSASGLMPMNHTVVVRRRLLEQHPWMALNLYQAFLDARRLAEPISKTEFAGLVDDRELEHPGARAFAADPFPYGIAANREVPERVCEYSLEQRLTNRLIGFDELFYPATLEL